MSKDLTWIASVTAHTEAALSILKWAASLVGDDDRPMQRHLLREAADHLRTAANISDDSARSLRPASERETV